MRLALTAGYRVLVCDNIAFSRDLRHSFTGIHETSTCGTRSRSPSTVYSAASTTWPNEKVTKFVGFNKNIRFQPFVITLVAGNNPIQIKDFELTLANDFPTKETLKTNDGQLTKTYSYKDGKLTAVVYQFTDLESRTNSLEKRF